MTFRIVIATCALLGMSCQKHAVVDPPRPPETTGASEAPAVGGSAIEYHRTEAGRPRVYLPLHNAVCQADESASVRYVVSAIWRFEEAADDWDEMDLGSAVDWRVSCNAMVDLVDVIGLELPAGTYAIASKVDGQLERGVIYVGGVLCNDVALGDPPPGMLALCIVDESSAEARFVPNPEGLEP